MVVLEPFRGSAVRGERGDFNTGKTGGDSKTLRLSRLSPNSNFSLSASSPIGGDLPGLTPIMIKTAHIIFSREFEKT